MSQKRYTTEQIIGMLRRAEVLVSQGKEMAEVLREIGGYGNTYYRWRKEYGGPNLERLRKRGLGKKRSLALREYALGYEALTHFVEEKPLHKVHECVFAVLALESEPVDPRL